MKCFQFNILGQGKGIFLLNHNLPPPEAPWHTWALKFLLTRSPSLALIRSKASSKLGTPELAGLIASCLCLKHSATQPLKKEQNNAICSNIDEPKDCHTEWSKSDTERQTSCYHLYMKSKKKKGTDFPGGPVVKTLYSQYSKHRFNPWVGN